MNLVCREVKKFSAVVMLVGLLVLAGCAGEEETSDAGKVETLQSESELEAYLKDQYANSVYTDNRMDAPQSDARDDTNAAAKDYTKTNIQEEGVDESDVVKTDGVNFYVSDSDMVNIVSISDPMQIIATLNVNGNIEGLYLHDHKLIVLYTLAHPNGGPWPDVRRPGAGGLFGMPHWIPVKKQQGVTIYNIADAGNPEKIKTVEFDGHLVSSRLINGKLHLVQQFIPDLPPLDYWYNGTDEDLKNKIEANRAAMEKMTLNQLMPYYQQIGDTPGDTEKRPLVSPQNFYCPATKDGGGTITSVVSFDLDHPELPFASVGVVANSHIVYASTQSLYLVTHQHDTEKMTDDDSAGAAEEAIIYRFSLNGDAVRYVGGGAVDGWVLNPFSLGEHKDVLRVATTTGHIWGWQPTSRNHVYCMQLEGQDLITVGSIENLAEGEKIYAARFMGERGYLVTYVKIDPLFTLDLSVPTAPKVVGLLKVPGYSDYIHPYGDNHLITVGKDTEFVEKENMAWYQGVQLSIFDVSDFANPTLLHKTLIGDRGTHSEALWNHKAFTFWPANNMLALPIRLAEHRSPPENPWDHGETTFQGLYVYTVSTESGFEDLGRISTGNDANAYPYHRWTRGIFADQQIYAVTPDAVRYAPFNQIENNVTTFEINPAPDDNTEEVKSDRPRKTDPSVPPAEMDALVSGNTQFAFGLYAELKDAGTDNMFYSPFSISMALAMAYAGAEGATETEMAEILGFELPEAELHAAFNTLDLNLAGRGTGEAAQFRLNIANAMWGQQGYRFETLFLDTLATNYGAGLRLLNFMADPAGSRVTINDWVENKTEGFIVDLLPESAITPDTRLVLTNAIYFKAEWAEKFIKDNTAPQLFHKAVGDAVAVDFMNRHGMLNYYAGTGYEAVELPYKGGDTTMIIIGPDTGTLQDFEAGLTPAFVDATVAGMTPTQVNLSVPKFKYTQEFSVIPILQSMGMRAPFSPTEANFSGINGQRNLSITDVVHKAFVAVDEEGTEAAAATGVVVGETSVPVGITVTLNRPFFFLIRDNVTGTVLFMGRMADPK